MKNILLSSQVRKFLFFLIGLVAIYFLISDYGLNRLFNDFKDARSSLFILILTFTPTLFLYSLAWMLVTDTTSIQFSSLKKILLFFKMMSISIAWNNLTPFLKMGGEPYKYFMLKKMIGKPKAMASTIIYNIVHLYATILSFMLTCILLPILFDIPKTFYIYFTIFFLLCLAILVLSLLQIKFFHQKISTNRFRSLLIKTKWSLRQSYYYYKYNRFKIVSATLCEIVARFIEGITFYYAFLIIKHPIAIVSSLFLEVGRTLVDTIFFFVPFQLGSREQGIRVFMENVMHTTSDGFLSAVFMYRFVELSWIVIGYLLWATTRRNLSTDKLSKN